MIRKQWLIPAITAILLSGQILAQERYPGEHWQQYTSPEDAGWSSERLADAKEYADKIGSAGVLVIYDGAILVHWGEIERRFMCHSIRKSFLSALYGIAADRGEVSLHTTVGDLGIRDKPPLTEQEKNAEVIHLLKARSGVYHSAAYETESMASRRPERGSHAPGTYWYYNNWDFNTLGTIFEQSTGTTIFQAFQRQLAIPLQMEDYRMTDGYYHLEREHSLHPAYPLRMSARDMARFGLLFLRNGRWNGRKIIPGNWVQQSTKAWSVASEYGRPDSPYGYGYLWWRYLKEPLVDSGLYSALGYGGHAIDVVPEANLVMVHRVDTFWDLIFSDCIAESGPAVDGAARLELLQMILDARTSSPAKSPELKPYRAPDPPYDFADLSPDSLAWYAGTYQFPGPYTATVALVDGELLMTARGSGTFRLLPLQQGGFLLEDVNVRVRFTKLSTTHPGEIIIDFQHGDTCRGEYVLQL